MAAANLTDQLANVKLKKNTQTRDASGPKLDGYVDDATVLSYQEGALAVNVDHWYGPLNDQEPILTFETEFIELTKEHATLFQKSYAESQKKEGISAETQTELDKVAKELQSLVTKLKGDGDSAFVKASSRSAKDTPIDSKDTLKERFLENMKLNKEAADGGEWDFDSSKFRSLLQAATDMMRIKDASQAINCFARSERIDNDMKLALDVASRSGEWTESFCVRKWHNIAVDMEFRGFVFGGKLRALSQYNHMFVSPRLLKNRDYLLKMMTDSFENQVKPRLDHKFSDYVIDFAVTGKKWGDSLAPSQEEERVWVIELNPFQFSTDATLYSWKQEHDLLTKGREDGKVDFRLREIFDPNMYKGIQQEWREILTQVLS